MDIRSLATTVGVDTYSTEHIVISGFTPDKVNKEVNTLMADPYIKDICVSVQEIEEPDGRYTTKYMRPVLQYKKLKPDSVLEKELREQYHSFLATWTCLYFKAKDFFRISGEMTLLEDKLKISPPSTLRLDYIKKGLDRNE